MVASEYYLRSIEDLLILVQNLCLAHSLEEITKIILTAVRKLTNADGSTFVLLDNGFCYYVDENAIHPIWKGQRFPMDTNINGWVILNKQATIIEDVSIDERVSKSVGKDTFVKSMAIFPMGTEQPMGAIGTYWFQEYEPSREQIKLMQLIANSAMVGMKNLHIYSQLERELHDRTISLESTKIQLQKEIQKHKAMEAEIHRLSLTDKLTGLHNRRGFYLLAEQQLRLAKRSQIYTSLMFFELNKIEEIHDSFGEELCEEAILVIARLLKRSFRSSDTLGRIGDYEFAVLMQGNEIIDQQIQERVETNITEFNQSHQLPFTLIVNIGIHSLDTHQNISLEDMITLAHLHIYQKKQP